MTGPTTSSSMRLRVVPMARGIAELGSWGLDDEYSSITIPREEDAGMRLAHVRLVDDPVLFMTERALLFFDGDLRLVWRSDEEFVGWSFEKVADGQVHLIWSDWSGREARQVRSLRHGRRTG